MPDMEWKAIVAQKRAAREDAIENTATLLQTDVVDECDSMIPLHASIALVSEKLSTQQISVETLVTATINR